MSTIEEKVRAQARAFDNLRDFENRHLVGADELKYLLEFENKLSPQNAVDFWGIETSPKIWLAAANLCANDLGTFVANKNGGIHFILICSDMLGSPTEVVSATEVVKAIDYVCGGFSELDPPTPFAELFATFPDDGEARELTMEERRQCKKLF